MKTFVKEGIMRFFTLLVAFLSFHFLTLGQQDCRSVEYRQALLSSHPGLAGRMQEIEAFTQHQLHTSSVAVTGIDHGQGPRDQQVITIPVIVHIIYSSTTQNISDGQILSQIAVLNRDYGKLNADTSTIPSYYRELAADCGIRFALASIDTNGNATTGIIRKHTNAQSFSYDDAIKFTSRGGDNAWDRDRYLNLWVGNLSNGVLGYSSAPGCPKETDGVVIHYTAFGTCGTAAVPFNLGRTATHEIGHWFNLIHVWGDAACGDDRVGDTPQQGAATRGNPQGMIFSCGNTPYGNLYMDFMDFTDDIGMHMFTYGQRDRMRTLFDEGGFRAPLLRSNAAPQGAVPPEPSPVGASNKGGELLSVYPNPAIDMVQVVTNGPVPFGSQLEIYDQRGQKIMMTPVVQNSFPLNISSLPMGLYFIRVRGAGKNTPSKLVKM